ncbi:cytochrome P450 CYP736A12-like [Arachis ipaensis]|uniref:cytochrome P450 CYP736A12-like n=1 Tax=Arachis ipaensis TaxID=130454 RepID=UPI0007AFB432|nr:cytochrome P450 CYP736A12-like [Arachis ipaensis]
MVPAILALPVLFLALALTLTILFLISKHYDRSLPPGPPAFPVFGNLPMLLGKSPHRTLQAMAQRYGPTMSLQLGQVPVVVVSNSEAAEAFLKTHEAAFASRPKMQASDCVLYGSKGLVFSEFGPYWRSMRRLFTSQLLSASKVSSFARARERGVKVAVKAIKKAAGRGEVVDISELVNNVAEDVVYRIVLGRSRHDEFHLASLLHEAINLAGAFNVADYLPWLGSFDFQGFTRRLKRLGKAIDQELEKIIEEHEKGSSGGCHAWGGHRDFIDILLSLMNQPVDPRDEQSQVMDRTNIKALLLDSIAGSFETSATVIIWVLSELLKHPRVMRNLQDELISGVGLNKFVQETHLANLSYLDIVIKETLRLHPPGAIVTRESTKDAMVNGYRIREKTLIIINLWAIGRDPKAWSNNAEEYYPERFITNNRDYRGYNFEFIPFGAGSRICPGIHLGLTTVKLVVAQLVHCFNWELPWNMTPDELDMNEKYGLSSPRAKNLLAVPTYRLTCEI